VVTFLKYLLWQLPSWLLVSAGLAWLRSVFDLPLGLVLGLIAAYVVKDLALYPTMRIIFRPPTRTQPIGKRGEVVEPLAPTGYVRVDGELWRATAPASSTPLPAGRQVVVRAAEGLTLWVDEVGPSPR
jgi:membrane protein implicated in regulation of membrane protease activity